MKVSIDTAKCVGHGRCYVLAPSLFTDDDAGYGQVIGDGTVPPNDIEEAHKGVASCPEEAVVVTE